MNDERFQCGSCEEFFDEPENGFCPNCGSGNWVEGCIDDPEPVFIEDSYDYPITEDDDELYNNFLEEEYEEN